jgi:hypothetical protein
MLEISKNDNFYYKLEKDEYFINNNDSENNGLKQVDRSYLDNLVTFYNLKNVFSPINTLLRNDIILVHDEFKRFLDKANSLKWKLIRSRPNIYSKDDFEYLTCFDVSTRSIVIIELLFGTYIQAVEIMETYENENIDKVNLTVTNKYYLESIPKTMFYNIENMIWNY